MENKIGVVVDNKNFAWPKSESWHWVVAIQIEGDTTRLVPYYTDVKKVNEKPNIKFQNFPGTFPEVPKQRHPEL